MVGTSTVGRGPFRNLLASTDGRHWLIARTFPAEESQQRLGFADGLWMLGGTFQNTNLFILTSTDGQTWTPATIPAGASWLRNLQHTPEAWFAHVYSVSTATHRLLRSLDGRSWTWSELVVKPPEISLSDIIYANGKWLGMSGVFPYSLLASTNLTDWQALPSSTPRPVGERFHRLGFADGLYFGLVGHSSRLVLVNSNSAL
jgi:hypothetical protein